MHRPLGRAAWVVSAPFSLAVARLHCPARLALAHLPAWVGGRAGWVACPKSNKECRSPTRVNKTGEAAQGFGIPAPACRGWVGQARRFFNARITGAPISPLFLLKPPLPIRRLIGTCPCLTPSLATAPASSLNKFLWNAGCGLGLT